MNFTRTDVIAYNILAPLVVIFVLALVTAVIVCTLDAIQGRPSRKAKSRKLTLRQCIDKDREFHMLHYGILDWHWEDEGLPYAILDYHSSIGSLADFTKDDFAAAAENGFTPQDLKSLCEWDA